MTRDEWMAKAEKLFGKSPKGWRFVCPVCKTEQGISEFLEHTKLEKKKIAAIVAFSCIGRWVEGGCATRPPKGAKPMMGCGYAGGGLFKLNPVRIEWNGSVHTVFEFAEVSHVGDA